MQDEYFRTRYPDFRNSPIKNFIKNHNSCFKWGVVLFYIFVVFMAATIKNPIYEFIFMFLFMYMSLFKNPMDPVLDLLETAYRKVKHVRR